MAGSTKVNNRKPYNGDRRALVLAFDVGTTFSGVSYAFLEPGEVPKIHGVTRYPGQEHVTGNTKIPSLLYYDRNGRVVAAGAEAESGQITDEAEDEGWFKVELFKLRLRPRRMTLDMNGMRLSPLPPGKSSEDVFGDFLGYLFSCSRKFIEDTHANGKNLWEVIKNDIHFVLSHPNGWEGAQQSRMRRSAISGGLIPNTDEGRARIRFVTEGEASMHACILSGLAHDVLASGNGFIVADAGGGTLDVSSYILRGTHPLQIEEVAPPDCVFAGAVFVSRRCRVFLEEKLRTSRYGTPQTLDHITKRFDETTKRLFRDKHDAQYIPFGSPLDKDLKVGIRGGQLKLTGAEVAELFEPSIEAATSSIRRQIELSRGAIKAVWLVGGFAASPWLFSQLQQRLSPLRVTVNRPDNQTSKAVADGAIGFFCDHHVSARMSRYMYGVEYLREIDVNDQEHVTRSGRQLQLPSGPKYLPDAFDCILAKNVRVKESSVFSRKYYTEVTKLSTLSVFEIEIWCYRGGETIPKWIDRNSDRFGSLCFVRADLSKLSNSAEPKKGANGQTYWTVVFSIEIHFGLTEFKARMKWNEDGKTRYGPATIVFNEKGVRSDEDDAYSVAGGDEPMSVSPRRPYGSLLNHATREPSTTTRSSRHRERGMSREHSHHPPAPPLSGADLSRSMSGQTDATSVETVIREPSPSPAAPPVVSSISSSMKGKSRSRGLGSTAPSAREIEPEPILEQVPSPPSMHSRAPSFASPPLMHSRAPSVAAPMSMHSRAPSTVVPPMQSRTPSVAASPSMQSRAPSVAVPPSMHSRPPSVAAPPSMHSRAPSVAAPPSMHSRAPSAAEVPSVVNTRAQSIPREITPVVSRAPSATQVPSAVPSRAPSAGAAPSPVPSRAPSVGRTSLSRAPSSGSRVPTVTRQNSSRGAYGSRAASQMDSLDEGDLYAPTEPDFSGSAAEYYNAPPSDGLDARNARSRSITSQPPVEPAIVEEPPQPPSKRNSFGLPSVSRVPSEEKKDGKRGFGFGGKWGSTPAEDPVELPSVSRSIPRSMSGQAEEPFIPPASGAASWEDAADTPHAPGAWDMEPPAPAEAKVIPEPEVIAPPVSKTNSGRSAKGKGKAPKGILKNGSASARAAEEEAKAKAEAEAQQKAEAEEHARQQAEAEYAQQQAEAEYARQQAEAQEYARHQAEAEARAREDAEMERLDRELAEQEQAQAREQAEINERARLNAEAEQRAHEQAEREAVAAAHARAEAERMDAEAREKAQAEANAKAEAEAVERDNEEWVQMAAPGEPGAAPTSTLAGDEESAKLEAAVQKAEKALEKAESELTSAEIQREKIPKPKKKGNKKPVPSPAEKSADQNVEMCNKNLAAAKDKLERAKEALAAYVPKEAPQAAPAASSRAPPAAELLPPVSNVPSTASGKGKKKNFDFDAFENDTSAHEEAEANERARSQAEAEQKALEQSEKDAAERDTQIEREAAETKAREAEARARDEEEAAAIASTESNAKAEAAAQAQAEAETEVVAETVAPAEPETTLAPAPAVDEESTKLEAAVEKAEKDLEKAQSELESAEIQRAKVPKAKKKGGKKAVPGPAEKAADRNVETAEKNLATAKEKLEKAKEALAAYVPKEAPPAAPAAPSPAPLTTEFLPPVSKVPSTASGKAKKSILEFDSFGLDGEDNKDGERDADAKGEGEEGAGFTSSLLGGTGGGWGAGLGTSWSFSSPAGGDSNAEGKSGTTFGKWF